MVERSWRRLAAVAGVLALYGLGNKTPLPGVDILSAATMLPGDSLARLSAMGLGLMPFMSVLIFFELAKLLLPPFGRWQAASPAQTDGVLRVLVAVLAVLQAYGVCIALQGAGLFGTDDGFAFVAAIATLVAGTLLLVWLADRIVLPGIGNGFWLLWIAPFVGGFLRDVVAAMQIARVGAATSADLLISAIYIVLAGAAVVVANIIITGGVFRGASSDDERPIALQALIWPPLLANLVAGYLATLPFLVWAFSPKLFLAIQLVCFVPLIALFVFTYMRKQPVHKISWLLLCLLELAVCLGGELLSHVYALPWQLNGSLLIITVTVMMSLLRLLPLPQAKRRPFIASA